MERVNIDDVVTTDLDLVVDIGSHHRMQLVEMSRVALSPDVVVLPTGLPCNGDRRRYALYHCRYMLVVDLLREDGRGWEHTIDLNECNRW
jgi:hypothetical protein